MAQMDSLDAHAVLVEDDLSGRLPVELLAAVFSHLEQPDILRAARVCNRWRAEAKQTRQFYRLIAFGHPRFPYRTPFAYPAHVTEAREFCSIVEDTCRDGHRVGIRISLSIGRHVPNDAMPYSGDEGDLQGFKMTEDVARELLLSAVIQSMPQIVRLAFIACDNSCLRLFLDALTRPAPLLTRLAVHGDRTYGQSPFKFSPTLFGGVAPVLRHLSCGPERLSGELLFGREPIPAFSLVSTVQLFHEPAEDLPAVLRLFPSVSRLDMGQCTKRFSLFSLSADIAEVQNYHTQVELLAGQLHFLRMESMEIQASQCSMTAIELATQAFAAFRDIPHVEVEFGYRQLAMPQALLEHMTSCPAIRADLHPYPRYSGPEDCRMYRLRVNSRIPLEKSRLIEVSGVDDARFCIKSLRGSVKQLVTELCMPQIFFPSCVEEIITRLPALRTLRLDVYPYLPSDLRNTYEYGPALFRVGYLWGRRANDPDDKWPTLRNLELLHVKSQGNGPVEVDEQSLLKFLRSLHFVGGQPRLVLSGPLKLIGDGEAKEASSFATLLGNQFSSVCFIRTEGGKPSFSAKASSGKPTGSGKARYGSARFPIKARRPEACGRSYRG